MTRFRPTAFGGTIGAMDGVAIRQGSAGSASSMTVDGIRVAT